MTKIEKLKEVVKQYRDAGCSSYNGMTEAMEEVFGYNHPYIHKDNCGDASHIFFENHVFFFSGELYSSI